MFSVSDVQSHSCEWLKFVCENLGVPSYRSLGQRGKPILSPRDSGTAVLRCFDTIFPTSSPFPARGRSGCSDSCLREPACAPDRLGFIHRVGLHRRTTRMHCTASIATVAAYRFVRRVHHHRCLIRCRSPGGIGSDAGNDARNRWVHSLSLHTNTLGLSSSLVRHCVRAPPTTGLVRRHLLFLEVDKVHRQGSFLARRSSCSRRTIRMSTLLIVQVESRAVPRGVSLRPRSSCRGGMRRISTELACIGQQAKSRLQNNPSYGFLFFFSAGRVLR